MTVTTHIWVGLNAHNTWCSDWDPTTHLMYIVRKNYCLVQTIAPFDPEDEPVVQRTKTGIGTWSPFPLLG